MVGVLTKRRHGGSWNSKVAAGISHRVIVDGKPYVIRSSIREGLLHLLVVFGPVIDKRWPIRDPSRRSG